jgi:hypothetical protein
MGFHLRGSSIETLTLPLLFYGCESCIAERTQNGNIESRAQSTDNGRIERI